MATRIRKERGGTQPRLSETLRTAAVLQFFESRCSTGELNDLAEIAERLERALEALTSPAVVNEIIRGNG